MKGTWLTAAATRRSSAAAASALPPPIEEPKVATRSGSMPGSERANAIAARQSSSWRRGMEEVGLAAAVAEAAVVEEERGDAGGGEALGEGPEAVPARPGEAVGHDDDRRDRRAARRRVEPGRARVAAGPEGEIAPRHASHTTSARGRM